MVALLVILLLLEPAPVFASAALSEIDGAVSVKSAEAWEKPLKGAILSDGTRVKVGPGARAELVFEDGSLLGIGGETELVLSSTRPKGRAVKLASGWALAKLHKGAEFRMEAPGAAISASGARLLTVVASDGVRLRVFSGEVEVKAKGRPTKVPEGTSVQITDNAGIAASRKDGPRLPIPGSGWMIEPPAGFQRGDDGTGLPLWKRAWQEPLALGPVSLTVRHAESIAPAVEEIEWTRGQPWPQDCRRANDFGNAVLAGPVRQDAAHGAPAFSYSCVVPGGLKFMDRTGGQPVWRISAGERHRYRDVAIDYNGSAAAHVVWLRYSHTLEVADIPGLEPEKMDEVRRAVGMTSGGDRDGPGSDSFFEILETLRPEPAPVASPLRR